MFFWKGYTHIAHRCVVSLIGLKEHVPDGSIALH
jgi:hypothetical protein